MGHSALISIILNLYPHFGQLETETNDGFYHFESVKAATECIDMTKHHGEHKRMGATDVVPFIPIQNMSIEEAVELKRDAVAGRSGKSTEPLGSAREDALEVLTALGYSPTDALKAVRNVEITEGMSAETVVKQALKRIGMA